MGNAAVLGSGSYSARWGDWFVLLVGREGSWSVKLWRWPPDAPLASLAEIGSADGFESPSQAGKWACQRMVDDGARVFVLDAPRGFGLEGVLNFVPAPALMAE